MHRNEGYFLLIGMEHALHWPILRVESEGDISPASAADQSSIITKISTITQAKISISTIKHQK